MCEEAADDHAKVIGVENDEFDYKTLLAAGFKVKATEYRINFQNGNYILKYGDYILMPLEEKSMFKIFTKIQKNGFVRGPSESIFL